MWKNFLILFIAFGLLSCQGTDKSPQAIPVIPIGQAMDNVADFGLSARVLSLFDKCALANIAKAYLSASGNAHAKG
ncbi:MAG: hypothetical protein LBM61_01360 [Prevotellaceae bacterium]|jgi:hypothetical protein|nr:hypothetical protein [Prevotellaceae bacterium]